MLDLLSSGFKKASEKFRGKATLSEENLADAMAEIQRSLLEADVEYGVVQTFIERVKQKSLGQEVNLRTGTGGQKMQVSAGDHFVSICKNELEKLMGEGETELKLPSHLVKIMMVGLQGTGKTTTSGKLAKYLRERKHRKPLLVAADIYRPAAVTQLKILGEKLHIPVFHIENAKPQDICQQAQKYAVEQGCDVIIYDTAGRLSIDTALMAELNAIRDLTKPDHILLVCDSMMGQDAVTTAKAFDERLALSGIVMTKFDGDSRGGAALSIREITGKPIKFVGTGEGLDRLEVFRPEGIASRILGMGDIIGLMEDFERVADGNKEEETMRMLQGRFNFNDFYEQIATIQKMGSLKDIIAKLPMQNLIPKEVNVDDRELVKIKSMIDSMTKKEKLMPDLIDYSRARRVAQGSGRSIREVTELVNRFRTMRKFMGKMGKNLGGGMMGKIPGMNALSQMNQLRKLASQGGMPGMPKMPGMPGFGDDMDFGGGSALLKRVDHDKIKKARKAAKKARQKNRKK